MTEPNPPGRGVDDDELAARLDDYGVRWRTAATGDGAAASVLVPPGEPTVAASGGGRRIPDAVLASAAAVVAILALGIAVVGFDLLGDGTTASPVPGASVSVDPSPSDSVTSVGPTPTASTTSTAPTPSTTSTPTTSTTGGPVGDVPAWLSGQALSTDESARSRSIALGGPARLFSNVNWLKWKADSATGFGDYSQRVCTSTCRVSLTNLRIRFDRPVDGVFTRARLDAPPATSPMTGISRTLTWTPSGSGGTWEPDGRAPTEPWVYTGGFRGKGDARARPTSIDFGLPQARPELTRVTWQSWDTERAVGTATYTQMYCDPGCVPGQTVVATARVTLDTPVHGHFTRATFVIDDRQDRIPQDTFTLTWSDVEMYWTGDQGIER